MLSAALALATTVDGHAQATPTRPFVEFAWGSLNQGDPFHPNMSFRAAAGVNVGARNRMQGEYTRQSANRNQGTDLGTYAFQFVGVAWEHAFQDAFESDPPKTQRYLVRIATGILVRGSFAYAVPYTDLKNAGFVDAGMVARYPFSDHVAAVGSIEDAIAFLPRQTVASYCNTIIDGYTPRSCYSAGGPNVFEVDTGGAAQHNFGVFMALELRP